MNIIFLAMKKFMLCDMSDDIEVSGRQTWARFSFSLQSELGAVADTCGNIDG